MQIEKEIKQVKFGHEYQRMVVNVLFTASWIKGHQAKLFKSLNITSAQYNVLRILRGTRGEKVSLQYIAERMIDRNSNASRIVDKLVKKGMVEREVPPSDRRTVEICITQTGKEVLKTADQRLEEWYDKMNDVPVDEMASLNKTLDRMRDCYEI